MDSFFWLEKKTFLNILTSKRFSHDDINFLNRVKILAKFEERKKRTSDSSDKINE